jgi:hypothetical protein
VIVTQCGEIRSVRRFNQRRSRRLSSSVDGTFIWMKSFRITVIEGIGDLDPGRRSVSGHRPRRGIFWRDWRDVQLGAHRRLSPTRIRTGNPAPTTRPLFLLSKPLSSTAREAISRHFAGGRHISTSGQTTTRPKGCHALEHFNMNLFSDSAQRMEELKTKSKKVRRGATLEEAEIDGSWLTT